MVECEACGRRFFLRTDVRMSSRTCMRCNVLRSAGGGSRTPQPTTALPGTPEKVEVLAQRFARGESLHHPDDARFDGPLDPELRRLIDAQKETMRGNKLVRDSHRDEEEEDE